jgi:hypothetical protein
MGTLHEDLCKLLALSRLVLLRMRNVPAKAVEKIEPHHLCSITFFFLKYRAVYEIMWISSVEAGKPQMTIWRVRIAFWITKATNTHSRIMYYLFPFQCSNGYANTPQYYVIHVRTFPAF